MLRSSGRWGGAYRPPPGPVTNPLAAFARCCQNGRAKRPDGRRESRTPVARILVVDDSAGVRELCAFVLGSRGHEVLQADCGVDALALYEQEGPDAVLLDVLMPGMDG